jgi:hypothetical protein
MMAKEWIYAAVLFKEQNRIELNEQVTVFYKEQMRDRVKSASLFSESLSVTYVEDEG